MTARQQKLHELLKKYWGYDSFRPLQMEIMESLLDSHDTVGLMPTGGGKSITFQIPGLYVDGLTVIISPLISLMKDQTDQLRSRRIKAVYFYSGMSSSDLRIAWDLLLNGKAKFLYCSPERLKNERFCLELKHLNVKHIIVDESHCISQWGYDFRPSYLNISSLRKYIPHCPVLALTATATPLVIYDICSNLNMRDAHVFRKSFTRPNLSYIVRPTKSKYDELIHILRNTAGSAIVYVRSRKKTREIADFLNTYEVSATLYHAGLSFRDKEERQDAWRCNRCRVMVATNAFGMGIDKSNVRTVIHFDYPPSLEEYFQEAGRAGRDGKTAYAVLLTSKGDEARMRRKLEESFPPRPDVKRVYELACTFLNVEVGDGLEKLYEFDIDKFCTTFQLKERFARTSLNLLTRSQLIEFIEQMDMHTRVKIAVTREELYEVNNLSADADRVLNHLLRNYTGLFTDFVFINEAKMQSDLNMSQRCVYEALIELRKKHVILFVPQKRMPYIFFPTAREETRHIKIPREVYEVQKDHQAKRLDAMLSYVNCTDSCRVEIMLRYFGEMDTQPCGKCDICRSKRGEGKSVTLESTVNYVLELIKQSQFGVSVRQLADVQERYKTLVDDALRFLLTSGQIKAVEGRYYIK